MNYRALALDMAAYESVEDLVTDSDLVIMLGSDEPEDLDLNDLDAELEQLAAYVTQCRSQQNSIGR